MFTWSHIGKKSSLDWCRAKHLGGSSGVIIVEGSRIIPPRPFFVFLFLSNICHQAKHSTFLSAFLRFPAYIGFLLNSSWVYVINWRYRWRTDVRCERRDEKVRRFNGQVQYKHDGMYAESTVHLRTVHGTNERKIGHQRFRRQHSERVDKVRITGTFLVCKFFFRRFYKKQKKIMF